MFNVRKNLKPVELKFHFFPVANRANVHASGCYNEDKLISLFFFSKVKSQLYSVSCSKRFCHFLMQSSASWNIGFSNIFK